MMEANLISLIYHDMPADARAAGGKGSKRFFFNWDISRVWHTSASGGIVGEAEDDDNPYIHAAIYGWPGDADG